MFVLTFPMTYGWPLGHPTTNNNKHVIRQRFLGKYIGCIVWKLGNICITCVFPISFDLHFWLLLKIVVWGIPFQYLKKSYLTLNSEWVLFNAKETIV